MVPDQFGSCTMAHKKAFFQRKNIFAILAILAFWGTLTDVVYSHVSMTKYSNKGELGHSMFSKQLD